MIIFISKGDIKTAVRSLKRNKGRSFLTMLGVIIGVLSVVMVIGIGEGVKQQINGETNRLGRDLITIRPGRLNTKNTLSELKSIEAVAGPSVDGALSDADVNTVQKTDGVATASPLSLVGGGVTSGETGQHYDALIIGSGSNLPSLLRQTFAFGAYFTGDPMSADKVVIGSRVARELYNENVPLGQTLTILGHQFIVVGIFNDFQTAPLSVDIDFNNAVFVQYPIAQQMTNGSAPIYEILARPTRPGDTETVVRRISTNLTQDHGGQANFTVLEQSQTIAVADSILNLLTVLIAGVAAISLLVGGVGIMNVMLVSIAERMHEIGIRKAIGATNSQILKQFVTEAAVLSFAGGFAGIILSLCIEIILRLFTGLSPAISWRVVAGACLVSISIGIVFGTVPALKAARKEPIDALRND